MSIRSMSLNVHMHNHTNVSLENTSDTSKSPNTVGLKLIMNNLHQHLNIKLMKPLLAIYAGLLKIY